MPFAHRPSSLRFVAGSYLGFLQRKDPRHESLLCIRRLRKNVVVLERKPVRGSAR